MPMSEQVFSSGEEEENQYVTIKNTGSDSQAPSAPLDGQPLTQPDSKSITTQPDSLPFDSQNIANAGPSRQDLVAASKPKDTLDVKSHDSSQRRGIQKKKKLTRVTFDYATEDDLGEWYGNNPIFYDKCLKEYKDVERKKLLMEEKARSLYTPVTGAELTVWFNGMRTRYGRLSEANKSGRGTASLSVRDQWILRTFSFLHSHIVRCPNRQTSKFSQWTPSLMPASHNVEVVMREGDGETEEADDPAHHELDVLLSLSGQTQCPRDDPGQATTTSTTTQPSHVAKGTKRKAAAEEAQDLLAQLLSRGAVPDLRQRLRDLRQPANPLHNKIDAWVCYLAAELHDFQPRVWNRFVSAATLLLHQCKEQNELQGASNDFPTKIWSPPVCTSNTKLQGASNNNFPTNIWSPPPPVCTSNTNTYYNDIDDDNNYDDIDDIETKCMQ